MSAFLDKEYKAGECFRYFNVNDKEMVTLASLFGRLRLG